ncbi:UNVERIFIED_CONTAM: hypothetical protein K2H54_055473 [Gekko kuhli]
MSGEEEDLRSLDELVIPVTTTPVTTNPVTMIPITTVPTTTMVPVTKLHMMTLSMLVYCPLNHPGVMTADPPSRESQYEYKPSNKTGTLPKCKGEKKDWEKHLAHMESTQDRLIQAVDEALMEIPGTIAQVVQAEIRLQLQ